MAPVKEDGDTSLLRQVTQKVGNRVVPKLSSMPRISKNKKAEYALQNPPKLKRVISDDSQKIPSSVNQKQERADGHVSVKKYYTRGLN